MMKLREPNTSSAARIMTTLFGRVYEKIGPLGIITVDPTNANSLMTIKNLDGTVIVAEIAEGTDHSFKVTVFGENPVTGDNLTPRMIAGYFDKIAKELS